MCDKICLHRNGTATRFSFVRRKRGKKKTAGRKTSLAKSAARRISLASQSAHPLPPSLPPSLPYPLTWYPLPCHRRPLACIFMKSLFRTTIHRDEQRTMTASAAEMRRWKLYEEGKKKRAGNGGEEKRNGRLVSIREGEKGGTSGRGREAGDGGKARTPTRATFSRSFLRSFVRFFVMTVDETMTYFSGFSLPGCPAALPFTPSLILPPFLPPFARNTRASCTPPRRHGCVLGLLLSSKVLRVFFLHLARYSSYVPLA